MLGYVNFDTRHVPKYRTAQLHEPQACRQNIET